MGEQSNEVDVVDIRLSTQNPHVSDKPKEADAIGLELENEYGTERVYMSLETLNKIAESLMDTIIMKNIGIGFDDEDPTSDMEDWGEIAELMQEISSTQLELQDKLSDGVPEQDYSVPFYKMMWATNELKEGLEGSMAEEFDIDTAVTAFNRSL